MEKTIKKVDLISCKGPNKIFNITINNKNFEVVLPKALFPFLIKYLEEKS